MQREIEVDMYAGGLVFWRASMADADQLRQAATDLGLRVSWMEVDPTKGLELSLRDEYIRQGKLIRRAKPVEVQRDDRTVELCPAMVVVDESQQDRANAYACSRRYWIDPATWAVAYDEDDGQTQAAQHIEAAAYRGKVLGANVSMGLERVVEQVGGYKLRDNARIYYMPSSRMPGWDAVAARFSQLGVQCFRANCPADAETATAVAHNTTAELRARYLDLMDGLTRQEAKLSDAGSSSAVRATAAKKRETLLAEIDAIKAEAAAIDASFRGLINIAGEISAEIDTAMAMAVLATAF
jgi:hypothetical protein